MANLTRCANGHFYDAAKYRTCPYCDQATVNTPTTPLEPPKKIIPENLGSETVGATIGYYDEVLSSPVVGWLVAIAGPHTGKDFRLCSGRNYIGRGADMDIVLADDPMVSRQKHAIVVFDPVSQRTLCQAGESRELFYRNGEVVTDTVTLTRGDIITIGKTQLMFVSFCGDLHTWNTEE